MNINEARRLSNENGFEKELEKEIEKVNKRIKYACNNGHRNACVFGLDEYKSQVEMEAKKYFLKKGYSFKPTGYVGGVYQHTEEICW